LYHVLVTEQIGFGTWYASRRIAARKYGISSRFTWAEHGKLDILTVVRAREKQQERVGAERIQEVRYLSNQPPADFRTVITENKMHFCAGIFERSAKSKRIDDIRPEREASVGSASIG
jgi:hypothetical protein